MEVDDNLLYIYVLMLLPLDSNCLAIPRVERPTLLYSSTIFVDPNQTK